MYQRKQRRFRRNRNGRGHQSYGNGHMQARLGSNSFSNSKTRNNFRTTLSDEKLLEKYNNLAKEAMSSGDKTLSENYLQHADHFIRIIEDKNKNREQSKASIIDKSVVDDKNLSKDSDIGQKDVIKNKE
tara:strand:+ start:163 stop:549 length:387 start_codon:yes stop_codon:yes gene_type:complete